MIEPTDHANLPEMNRVSLMVEILFRSNCSLQGDITWLEKNKTRSFRSLLELLFLLQGTCEEPGAPPADYQLRTWCDAEVHDQMEAVDHVL